MWNSVIITIGTPSNHAASSLNTKFSVDPSRLRRSQDCNNFAIDWDGSVVAVKFARRDSRPLTQRSWI